MKSTYSVGEVASILGVSAQTLRKYEQKGILKPVRGENNYRSYEAPDITMLLRIRMLRNMGFSLDVTQALLSRERQTPVQELYEARIEALRQEIERLNRMMDCVRSHRDYYQEQLADDGGISMEEFPEIHCLFYRSERKVMQRFLEGNEIAEALEHSPPYRYVISLPGDRDLIRRGDYRVGLAVEGDPPDALVNAIDHIAFPACRCATVIVRHAVRKKPGQMGKRLHG